MNVKQLSSPAEFLTITMALTSGSAEFTDTPNSYIYNKYASTKREENGKQLQHSCLECAVDRGAVHGVAELDATEGLSTYFYRTF